MYLYVQAMCIQKPPNIILFFLCHNDDALYKFHRNVILYQKF